MSDCQPHVSPSNASCAFEDEEESPYQCDTGSSQRVYSLAMMEARVFNHVDAIKTSLDKRCAALEDKLQFGRLGACGMQAEGAASTTSTCRGAFEHSRGSRWAQEASVDEMRSEMSSLDAAVRRSDSRLDLMEAHLAELTTTVSGIKPSPNSDASTLKWLSEWVVSVDGHISSIYTAMTEAKDDFQTCLAPMKQELRVLQGVLSTDGLRKCFEAQLAPLEAQIAAGRANVDARMARCDLKLTQFLKEVESGLQQAPLERTGPDGTTVENKDHALNLLSRRLELAEDKLEELTVELATVATPKRVGGCGSAVASGSRNTSPNPIPSAPPGAPTRKDGDRHANPAFAHCNVHTVGPQTPPQLLEQPAQAKASGSLIFHQRVAASARSISPMPHTPHCSPLPRRDPALMVDAVAPALTAQPVGSPSSIMFRPLIPMPIKPSSMSAPVTSPSLSALMPSAPAAGAPSSGRSSPMPATTPAIAAAPSTVALGQVVGPWQHPRAKTSRSPSPFGRARGGSSGGPTAAAAMATAAAVLAAASQPPGAHPSRKGPSPPSLRPQQAGGAPSREPTHQAIGSATTPKPQASPHQSPAASPQARQPRPVTPMGCNRRATVGGPVSAAAVAKDRGRSNEPHRATDEREMCVPDMHTVGRSSALTASLMEHRVSWTQQQTPPPPPQQQQQQRRHPRAGSPQAAPRRSFEARQETPGRQRDAHQVQSPPLPTNAYLEDQWARAQVMAVPARS